MAEEIPQEKGEKEMTGSSKVLGHGHVNPLPLKARCGGPGICRECALEKCISCDFIGALHCPKCLRCPHSHHDSDCPNKNHVLGPKLACTCRGVPDPEFDFNCPIHGENSINAVREREEREFDDLPLDLRELVYQAVGAASMCWSNINGAGEFNSTQACKVARQLVLDIQEITLPRPPSTIFVGLVAEYEEQKAEEPVNEEGDNRSGICYFCGGTEGDIWPFYDFQESQEIQAHTPCARNHPDRIRLNGE
jgi:hypothetical protein